MPPEASGCSRSRRAAVAVISSLLVGLSAQSKVTIRRRVVLLSEERETEASRDLDLSPPADNEDISRSDGSPNRLPRDKVIV